MGSSPEPPSRVVGRYALYGELASGGMATVHFGRLLGPVGFSRTVAIKRLHAQFAKDPEFVSMFLDEARLAGRIRHPNVVPTLDVVATQGELFLVMDYIQGESLSRLLRGVRGQLQKISPNIVAAMMSGVLHGLHAAHEAKDERGEPLSIVHRDVSPQNILVGTDGIARVLDFGVAKAAGRLQTTKEGQIKGKLAYMPPEQLRGGSVTRAGDIYAAAVVLWETLTAQRLFTGENEGAVLTKILEGRVPTPSRIVSGLPPAVDAVVLRGLDRNPMKRFETAREMALALERSIALAPPSEVGEWVENTAGSVLMMRAERVAEIESTTSLSSAGSLVAAVGEGDSQVRSVRDGQLDAAVFGGRDAGDVSGSSQLSSISVSKSRFPPSASAETWARHRTRVALSGIIVVALLALFVFVIVGQRRPMAAGAAGAAGARSGSSAFPTARMGASALAAPPSPVAAMPANSGPALGAPTDSVGGNSPAPPSRAPSIASPRRPAPRPAAATSKSSCDPPFTLDEAGHKHYKLECL